MATVEQQIDAKASFDPTKVEPGIYTGLSFEEYLAIDALSNSRLSQAAKSMAHFHANPAISSSGFQVGRLLHCGQLEPRELAKRYAVSPDYGCHPENVDRGGSRSFSPNTVWAKTQREAFEKANEGKEIVCQATYDEMLVQCEAIARDPEANRLLNSFGPVEVTIVWLDEFGFLCKARADKAVQGWGEFVDLKSTADAKRFTKSIASFGYHRQAAHYQDGIEWQTGIKSKPWFVAVETSNKSFNLVRTAPMSEEAISVGRDEIKRLKEQIAECYDSGEWPGYGNPESWVLPGWYESQQDDAPIDLVIGGKTVQV